MMNEKLAACDELLLELTQRTGSDVTQLLHCFFSFLERRSDFYHVVPEGQSTSYGFPALKAKRMVMQAFKKYEKIHSLRSQANHESSSDEHANKPMKTAIYEKLEEKNKSSVQPLYSREQGSSEAKRCTNETSNSCSDIIQDQNSKTGSHSVAPTSKLSEIYRHINHYNGGETKDYWWNQTMDVVTIELKNSLFSNQIAQLEKSKIEVTISSNQLKISYATRCVLDGKFFAPVKANDSTWMVEDNSRLVVILYKIKEQWWHQVFEGLDSIDTSKLKSTKQFYELDPETQASISKALHGKTDDKNKVTT